MRGNEALIETLRGTRGDGATRSISFVCALVLEIPWTLWTLTVCAFFGDKCIIHSAKSQRADDASNFAASDVHHETL